MATSHDDPIFIIPAFRLLLTACALFASSLGLAWLCTSTGDLLQSLLTPLQLPPPATAQHRHRKIGTKRMVTAAATFITASDTLIVALRFLLGDGDPGDYPTMALIKDSDNVCMVFLMCEAVAAAVVGVAWAVAKGVEWGVEVRREYGGWYGDGVLDSERLAYSEI